MQLICLSSSLFHHSNSG